MILADLIITGADVITLDPARPRASAIAVRGETIVAVGDEREVLAVASPLTRRMDLPGRTIVPGFIDCHIHLIDYGAQVLREADLVGSANIDEIVARLADVGSRLWRGWIQGYGFDQDKLAERRMPTRQDLDRVSVDRPVVASRVCGHAVVVNSAALALLSDEQRLAGDERAGLYLEDAAWSILRKVPPLDDAELERAILLAADELLKTGITSAHVMLADAAHLVPLMRLRRRDALPIRVTAIAPYSAMDALHGQGIQSNTGDDWLRFGAVKLFADGSLGARTALLSEPYADDPKTRGVRIHEPDQLKALCAAAHDKGFQVAVHAIGDQAVREAIDAIEHALGDDDNARHRHRIEHASLCPADCIERLARRRIIATLQPQFVTSDTWTASRIGPARIALAYPFRSMVEARAPVAIGSDCPVERPDAMAALAAAVGRHEWSPEQTLTGEQALAAYCRGGACAAFADDRVGSLAPGRLADLVVLPADPTRLAPAQLRTLRPERVFVAGREVDREGNPTPSAGSSGRQTRCT